MTQSLEADVNYLYKIDGARQTIQPAGFGVRTATRRPARGRDRDLLFVAVILHPRSPASSARPAPLETSAVESEAVDLVNVATNSYFSVAGSVTSALRETGNAVNLALLQWNLRMARQAINAQGSLLLAVLRQTELYVAQAGSASLTVVRPDESERFPSEPRDSRPLGISQSADLFLSLSNVAAGDFLVLGNEVWADAALAGFNDLTLELAADRLAERSGPNAAGLVARFVPSGAVQSLPEAGSGSAFGRLRDKIVPARPASPTPRRTATPRPQPPPEIEPAEVLAPLPPPPPHVTLPKPPEPVVEMSPEPEEFTRSAAPVREATPRRRPPSLAEDDGPIPTIARSTPARSAGATARSSSRPSPLASLQAAVEKGLNRLGQQVQTALGTLFRHTLPEGVLSDRVRMPISWMAAIAIVLPVIVGLVITSVYLQRGQAQQYNGFLEQAQLEVSQARSAPDSVAAQPHWQIALKWLDQADAVRPGTAEVVVLRAEAIEFLDSVEQTTRLDYRPVVEGGFGGGVQLSNLVVIGSEVYALDPALGRVFRAFRTESGAYTVDEAFNKCATGPVGPHNVGPIVDMVWLAGPGPTGSDSLVVMDGAGTLAFCPPDGSPPLASQLVPPDIGWTGPRAIAVYTDGLYVLDPPGNQVWVFARPGGQFTEGPSRYFTGVTYDLSQAVDIAIANGEVFIVFADGHITSCNRSADGTQVVCNENAAFTDGRQGHTSGPKLDDVRTPIALLYDAPPEPSLYLADAANSSIYQLSLKLVLQRRFRPAGQFGAPITAIAIGSGKELYVASGNNVYVGARP